MRYVFAHVKEDLLASQITKQIDVLQVIEWVAKAWEEVTAETIRNCFAKCGFTKETCEIEVDIVDEEFKELFKEITDSDSEITAKEYIDFDTETCSSVSVFNSDEVDWRVSSVENG